MEINVIDSIMGSGKTQYAIQEMNSNNKNYIYITPFLSEVQRIKDNVTNRRFYEPLQRGKGKINSLIELIKDNKSIASTHALFSTATDELMDLIKLNKYTLILDEVMDVIDIVNLKKDDVNILLNEKLISVDENGKVTWNKDDYTGIFSDIKIMAQHNRLIMANDSLLLWMFPIDVFECFDDVKILTYMFDGQIMKFYYDLYNIRYKYNSVKSVNDKYELIEYQDNKEHLVNLIDIFYDDKLNSIGENKFNLSFGWYEKAKDSHLDLLRKNLVNFFINKKKAKSKDILWTTFLGKDDKFRKYLQSKGYQSKSCFAPMNSRATNDYRDKTVVAYTVNRFINPFLKNFFTSKSIKVNEDTYALSEMLQFIFRSGIRQGNKISIYIPSSRMRELLENWLK